MSSSYGAVAVDDGASISSSSSKSSTAKLSCTKEPNVETTESTPLLRSTSPPLPGDIQDLPGAPRKINPGTVIALAMAAIVLCQGSSMIFVPASARVFESIYCYQYWEEHDPSRLLLTRSHLRPGALGGVDEKWCKGAEVQSKVATLFANQEFFDGIPALLLAIPFGMLADAIGRKPVLWVAVASLPIKYAWLMFVPWFWQSLDLRWAWASSVNTLLGGSSGVLSALIMTMVADVVPEADRTTTFFRIMASGLIANFLAPPLAAAMMRVTPWLALLFSEALLVLATLLLWSLPETLHYRRSTDLDANIATHTKHTPISTNLAKAFRHVAYIMTHDWRVPALMCSFLPYIVSVSEASNLLLQYSSVKYSMTLSRATIFNSIRPGVTLISILTIMPMISWLLRDRWGYDTKKADLTTSRLTAAMSAIGWMLVAFAPNIPFFVFALLVTTLGASCAVSVRSFLTSLVEPDDVAKLYIVIGVVDTLGLMSGAPVFAWMFKRGLEADSDLALGLPFWVLGALFAVVAIMMLFVGIRKTDGEERVVDSDDGEA